LNQPELPFPIKKIDSRMRCGSSGTLAKVAAWFLSKQKEHTHANPLWRHRYPCLSEMQKINGLDEAHAASVAGPQFRTADFYLLGLPL
jgi:hypothetical protein